MKNIRLIRVDDRLKYGNSHKSFGKMKKKSIYR